MEETLPLLNTSYPTLLNTTWQVTSIYVDQQADTTFDQQQYYQQKINSLESELNSLTRNQILIQSEFVKLVETKDIQLCFDRNMREYHMVFHKGRAAELPQQRFYFDSTENGGLMASKIDTISSIVGMDHTLQFDMFSTSEGMTPRVLDQNRLLRPPNYFNFNARPISPLSDNSDIEEQPSQSLLFSNLEGFEAEISRLENELLQCNNKSNVQLFKINQPNNISIPMTQVNGKWEAGRWEGDLEVTKQTTDVSLQTDGEFLISQSGHAEHMDGKSSSGIRIVERVVERVVKVPFQTLVIVEQMIPIMNENSLEVDFEQFNVNSWNQQATKQTSNSLEIKDFGNQGQESSQSEVRHADEKTRDLYNKVISQNDFLRDQVITLIDQLQDYKKELEKNRSINSQLQFKLNSAGIRDFYKVKLSDLERKISQKTFILEELQKNIENIQTKSPKKTEPRPEYSQHHSSQQTSELVRHYESTFLQMNQQIESLKTKIYELRERESSRIEDESSKISRYIEEIESRQKEIQQLSKANQEYRSQLQQQLEANGDLRNIVEKLWQQTEELSAKLSEKIENQLEVENMHQEESKLTQDKEDIEMMNHLVSSLKEEISLIKEQLYDKQQKQIEDRMVNEEYELKLRQNDEQIEMQRLTIDQFKYTCQKSEEYIMLLNQEIHHLKRLQQKSQNTNALYPTKSKGFLKNSRSLNTKDQRFSGEEYSQKGNKLEPSHIADFKNLLSMGEDNSNKLSQKSSNLDSSVESNRTEREIFMEQLERSEYSSQIIHQLISILKETNSDIQTVESQNKYLKNLMVQYEKMLQNTSNTPNPQLSEDQIVNVLIQNQRLEKELSEAQSSNIDINFFEQIVNELEKTKLSNRQLSQQIEEYKSELLNSEAEIFQKTQAINYLNLALIKTSGDKGEMKSTEVENVIIAQLRLQNTQYKHELDNTLEINRTLQASIQKLSQIKNHQIRALNNEINSLQSVLIPNLKRQIRHLELELETSNRERSKILRESQARDFYRGNKEPHSKSAINVIDKFYGESVDVGEMKFKKLGSGGRSMKRLSPVQKSIEEIKGESMSTTTLLYIMYRVTEYVEQKLNQGVAKLLSPKSMVLLNYSDQTPELIQIMVLPVNPEDIHLFSPPEMIEGEQTSQTSMSWNIGMLFDYLIHGSLFYKTKDEIVSEEKEDLYVFRKRKMVEVRQIVEGLINKEKQKRRTVEKTLKILKQMATRRR